MKRSTRDVTTRQDASGDGYDNSTADFSKAATAATHENQRVADLQVPTIHARLLSPNAVTPRASMGFMITPALLKRLGLDVPTLK